MRGRRQKIDSNPLVLAGVYLEACCIRFTGENQAVPNPDVSVSVPDVGEPPSKIGRLVGSLYDSQGTSSSSQGKNNLHAQLDRYESDNFGVSITYKTDPTEFWLNRTNDTEPTIRNVATTVLKIITCPLTEVTSERLFSLLNFVVNKLRCQLKDDITEDILFCKWNQNRFFFNA